MIELLLASGAGPSLLLGDGDGFTPAQLALVRGHQKAARLLLQRARAAEEGAGAPEPRNLNFA